jgi:putative aldouronate transport system substrate-binding protein
LQWLSDLYRDGGLDKDFKVLKYTQVGEKIQQGKAGILLGGQTSDYATYVEHLINVVDPKAQLIMIKPPAGPDGTFGFRATKGFFGEFVIPSDIEEYKVKKIVELLDWMSTDEAYQLKIYGLEGIHHKKNQDGTLSLDYKKIKEEGISPLIPHNPYDKYGYVSPWASDAVQEAQKTNLDLAEEWGIPNPVSAFQSPTEMEIGNMLTQISNDYFVKIVTGDLPITAFEQFQQEWLDKGGRQLTEEVNAWYKANHKNNLVNESSEKNDG